jgi:copper chaperone
MTTSGSRSTITLDVEGMTCGHCARAVTEAIQARDPAARVQVDLQAGTVRAETVLPRGAVAEAVAEEGYKVAAWTQLGLAVIRPTWVQPSLKPAIHAPRVSTRGDRGPAGC